MKRIIGTALLAMLIVGSLGLAQAADPVTVTVPANDALNGSITVSADENAGTGSVYAEGAEGNPGQLAGYLYADSDGTCYADGEGDLNDDSDGDNEPDNQTCEEAVYGYLPE